MRFHVIIFLFILCFFTNTIFSQNTSIGQSGESIQGIWENNAKIISIQTDEDGTLDASITLKTFYTYFYDGVYSLGSDIPINLARINDGLYTEYWEKKDAYATLGDPILQEEEPTPVFKVKIERPMKFDISTAQIAEGVLWLPKSNITELSIDEAIVKDEVLGFYIDDTATYEIRYWLCDAEYSDDKVELKLIEHDTEKAVFIDKYVQIGNLVYTSATGLRTEVRNVKTIEAFGESVVLNDDETILSFGDAYLTVSDITNVEDAILYHNSIPRPPRNGLAKFVEPSIYKKLEEMTLEDFRDKYASD